MASADDVETVGTNVVVVADAVDPACSGRGVLAGPAVLAGSAWSVSIAGTAVGAGVFADCCATVCDSVPDDEAQPGTNSTNKTNRISRPVTK
jgi:hypothetical protein